MKEYILSEATIQGRQYFKHFSDLKTLQPHVFWKNYLWAAHICTDSTCWKAPCTGPTDRALTSIGDKYQMNRIKKNKIKNKNRAHESEYTCAIMYSITLRYPRRGTWFLFGAGLRIRRPLNPIASTEWGNYSLLLAQCFGLPVPTGADAVTVWENYRAFSSRVSLLFHFCSKHWVLESAWCFSFVPNTGKRVGGCSLF